MPVTSPPRRPSLPAWCPLPPLVLAPVGTASAQSSRRARALPVAPPCQPPVPCPASVDSPRVVLVVGFLQRPRASDRREDSPDTVRAGSAPTSRRHRSTGVSAAATVVVVVRVIEVAAIP